MRKYRDTTHQKLTSSANLKARQSKVIPVVVGGPQDTFNPNAITAAVGDIVQFQFSNGNHTATQSTLEAPCTPLEGGINSGHIPFQDGQTDVGTFSMVVSGTDPIFMFCSTGPHCQEGQVMIINPTGPQQLLDFVKGAQGTDKSGEGTAIAGGTTSKIQLTNAA
jgi:plastocyanin